MTEAKRGKRVQCSLGVDVSDFAVSTPHADGKLSETGEVKRRPKTFQKKE